ncbi:MAG: hypothetical protein GOMPHAMPRED_000445 [Gomphillus americanus]|uniref:Arrestin C-terminal-like domain-containing protein n=1 Tax=Gomphillus americanus TaxID=1940652 RepID=A0A8H3EDS5_9LECA|nr:MAG: hypothetical protein GOMPHAMPRED_000445 [Gomphillus americanus]
MAAHIRVVSQAPNQNMLVGYPGISATLPRLEGKVEIRPGTGVSAPVTISTVTVSLWRRESIHPSADSLTKKHLAAPRKEVVEIVGEKRLLYQAPPGKESEIVYAMDLPFVLFIPVGRGGEETARRVPSASLQLSSRTAETCYEIVVWVQQGTIETKTFHCPVPITRYDTLSTFGMYNRPESAERITDHLVTLGINLPRWSYGPLDPVSVYIKLAPNPDWLKKATRATINKITISIEEEVIYNHEGDEPTRKTKTLARTTQAVGIKLGEQGYFTTLGLVFPARDQRDNAGILPRGKNAFPMYQVSGFTTTASLYKIEYYLTVKAHMQSAKDILLRQPIVVCPLDHARCKEEMEAIEQAAKDAAMINPDNPMLPAPTIIRTQDWNALHVLGMTMVGNTRKPLIQ